MKPWFCSVFLIFAAFGEQKNYSKILYNKNGNVSIIGIFNSFSGNECSYEVAKGLEETASAIWTVEALNNMRYLPGITIGLTILDGCHYTKRQKITHGMIDAQLSENNVGILMGQEIYERLEEFESQKIMQLKHVISPELLVELTLQLLLNLQWMTLRAFVTDCKNILNLFKKAVEKEKINVLDYILMNERNFNLDSSAAGYNEIDSVIVVVAAYNNIPHISENVFNRNFKLIITPTDFNFEFTGLPNDTIVLLPSIESKSVLSKYIKSTGRYKNFFSHKGPTKSPLFIGTAVNILKLLKPVKNLFDKHCGDANFYSGLPCARAVDFIGELIGSKTSLVASKSTKISPDDMLETLNVLKIKPSLNDEMFLYIASMLSPNVSEDLSIFKIFSIQTKTFGPVLLKINDNLAREIFVRPEHVRHIFESEVDETKEFSNSLIRLPQKFPLEGNLPSENDENVTTDCGNDEECKIFGLYPKTPSRNATDVLGWRFLTWVCINTALAFTGVTCTLSVMLFIFIRVFKGDALESSLCFNLLLMISVIFIYTSSLFFHLEYLADNHLLCLFRINAPPIVCAVLFSLLLSRSLMLAFNDRDTEFSNHINGYLHSILCILMISLQMSITIQNWTLEKIDKNCSAIHKEYKLIIALSYDFILLLLLACISPFIICSKRNNKEGLLISVSVFFITVVWSTWICFYILFSNEYKDAAVAVGLNLTATVIVFCIFIPRTYFMTIPTVQDSSVCYIPTLGKLTGSLNINGQSSQTLHESAVGVISYKNRELGTSNPNFHTNRSDDGRVDATAGYVRESVVDLSSETG